MNVRITSLQIAVAGLCLGTGAAGATEFGTVVSSTPIVAAVPVAQRQCAEEQVLVQPQNSGAGALIGALAGAAIGNNIGSGGGRALATGIGLIAGSQIGDRAEANASPPVATTQQRCRTVTRYENRLVGYDVVYDYQGVRRSTRVARDPGDRIALDVNVAPSGAMAQGPAVVSQAAPVYAEAPVEIVQEEPLPPRVVYAQPYYYDYGPRVVVNPWPVVGIGLGLGWHRGGGWGGHERGHWR
jgi:uncharacterized protein YcfJ